MNLQTLISYKEFCFLGRTRAATNGPDESRRAQHGVARRFLARGWVQCTNRCLPEVGFSQSRRASPAAHQSTPQLPVSRCRFPLAFCRTVTARRKPAHSLFRLYSVEKIFSTTPLLPSRTPHVLGLRKPRSHKCRGSHNLAQSFAWLLATHLLPRQPRVIFFSSLCSPPASGWADRRGTTYGATKITRDHFKLSSAASIAAQAPPRLPPYRYH